MDNPTLAFIWRNMLWMSAPLMILGLLLLGFSIMRVIKIVKKAEVLRVPLAHSQRIELPEAGRLVLCGEGPLLTTRFGRLKYGIVAADGTPVKSRMTPFRATTTGMTWCRMELRILSIPEPGRYTLDIDGLGAPRENDDRHWVVFMRPHLAKMVLCVLGIVLGAILFIANLVFFLLRLITAAPNQ